MVLERTGENSMPRMGSECPTPKYWFLKGREKHFLGDEHSRAHYGLLRGPLPQVLSDRSQCTRVAADMFMTNHQLYLSLLLLCRKERTEKEREKDEVESLPSGLSLSLLHL